MQTLTQYDQWFMDAAKKLRSQAVFGERDPNSFVGSIVSVTFEKVARVYADGEYNVEFEYSPVRRVENLDATLKEIRQALGDLFGVEKVSVHINDHHCFGAYGIAIRVGF